MTGLGLFTKFEIGVELRYSVVRGGKKSVVVAELLVRKTDGGSGIYREMD